MPDTFQTENSYNLDEEAFQTNNIASLSKLLEWLGDGHLKLTHLVTLSLFCNFVYILNFGSVWINNEGTALSAAKQPQQQPQTSASRVVSNAVSLQQPRL